MVESKQEGFAKTCYYELLGVDRKAEQKQIEKGFKKAALKWHPDKNRDRDTTEQFQQIQEAYQCLNNPQERAWYDQHRDQILRGKEVGEEANEEDATYITKAKLDRFFTDSVYAGFEKSEHGIDFFSVYSSLFEQMDREEEMEEEVGTKHSEAPKLGDESTSKEEVYAFYKFWSCFSTLKQFAYVDVYDVREAPNRRIKRLIENDNKRERNKERAKFNEKVHDLISHMKKHDIRYEKYVEADRAERRRKIAEEERIKQERLEAEQEAKRKYKAELAEYYQKMEEEAILRGDFDEVIVEEFACQMCKKTFKKEGQMKNHLQSKKHKEMEAKYNKLRSEVQLDEETEMANQAALEEQFDEEKRRQGIAEEEIEEAKKKNNQEVEEELQEMTAAELGDLDDLKMQKDPKKGKNKKQEKNKGEKVQNERLKELEKSMGTQGTGGKPYKKMTAKEKRQYEFKQRQMAKKKAQQENEQKDGESSQAATVEDDVQSENSENESENSQEETQQPLSNKKQKASKKTFQNLEVESKNSSDSDSNSEEEIKKEEIEEDQPKPVEDQFKLDEDDLNWDDDSKGGKGKKGKNKNKKGGPLQNQQAAATSQQQHAQDDTSEIQESGKGGKAKQRRQKKQERGEVDLVAGGQFRCNVCKNCFESRSKLMKHCRELKHERAV